MSSAQAIVPDKVIQQGSQEPVPSRNSGSLIQEDNIHETYGTKDKFLGGTPIKNQEVRNDINDVKTIRNRTRMQDLLEQGSISRAQTQ